ncbi:uncharacterized protein LOC115885233 [Sitophilus oryzae]|uniref:Uncharacterized protein LOC115885233 n=1 Tax=Sitophilus oryzae TaxID=7048 RepID=A0A6J2YAH8_SITOR|nr:uncharacterized protein LOC115885233 [Sitophilus oryzae]
MVERQNRETALLSHSITETICKEACDENKDLEKEENKSSSNDKDNDGNSQEEDNSKLSTDHTYSATASGDTLAVSSEESSENLDKENDEGSPAVPSETKADDPVLNNKIEESNSETVSCDGDQEMSKSENGTCEKSSDSTKESTAETTDAIIRNSNDIAVVLEPLNLQELAVKQTAKRRRKSNSKQKDEVNGDGSEPQKKRRKGKVAKNNHDGNKAGGSMQDGGPMDEDMDMDDDFDPSLLCPDISMDVDEALVITNTAESTPNDGSTSPLPYEPTFSELVDEITGAEVQIDLTPEEEEIRQKIFNPENSVQYTRIHCTACNVHLGSALFGANNRFVHPLLKVLICKNCYHFYTSGEFEKDEDGSELYCRWCGQGGQVLCCSSCEFVFCKRCIRNNFGPRKFKEIRDSDDWNCFRCDSKQLGYLKASCAEFMNYYRTELRRVQVLAEQHPELMTTDYTKCCSNDENKPEESSEKAQQAAKTVRRKRKDSSDDPDYKPVLDDGGDPFTRKSVPAVLIPSTVNKQVPAPLRPLLPKGGVAPVPTTGIRQILLQKPTAGGPPRPMFKVGNTTFRAKPGVPTSYTIQRPTLGQTPSIIKLVPQRPQGPRPIIRPTSSLPVNNRTILNTVLTTTQNKLTTTSTVKHEWFEKTVRASARVNSNLSYTLTQLNRQQSVATSVEALAVVHNKLQEVLSTSINTLIQIRKNLRTEFIAGIKNIKLPPKQPVPTAPILVKDDDDVIFVNPAVSKAQTFPPPPPLVFQPVAAAATKQITASVTLEPRPSTSKAPVPVVEADKPASPVPRGGFLKVRSFSALQNVTSECITIPDDPPPKENVEIEIKQDPLVVPPEIKTLEEPKEEPEKPEDVPEPTVPKNQATSPMDTENFVYNVNEAPSAEVRRMMNAIVQVKKSRVIDEIIRVRGLYKTDEVT